MNVTRAFKRSPIRRVAALLLAALAVGAGMTVVDQSVSTPKANADVLFYKVSSGSERTMRICPGADGRSERNKPCLDTRAGQWSLVHSVGSVRVDANCELWESGQRKMKRESRDRWYNHPSAKGKVTGKLINCRAGSW